MKRGGDPQRFLHHYTALTAVMTFVLLVAGGLVTSTDSGLAVPDWPLSYGMWFPPMVGGILYEHGHRMIAATVGLMIVGLAVWLWRVEPRRWVRRLGYAAVGAVILQGLLGGLTVLLLLPPQVSIAHATLGPTVFCLVVCLSQATAPSRAARLEHSEDAGWPSPAASGTPEAAAIGAAAECRARGRPAFGDHSFRCGARLGRPSLRVLGVALAALAVLQLVLGAIVRHAGGGVTWHVAGAACLLATWAWMMQRIHRLHSLGQSLRSCAARLGWLLMLQLALGGLAWWHRAHVGVVTLHVGMGSLVLAQAVLLAWQSVRDAEQVTG
ncbi:MAG: COX15/CtaA family protein [Candidatus Omnitrophota bacterium]|nr:COX15/CtaA family protein [Candidatus Omnitrophota bacterium]